MDKTTDNSTSGKTAEEIFGIAKRAKIASAPLAMSSLEQRNNALRFAAEELKNAGMDILSANESDLAAADAMVKSGSLSSSALGRLQLTQAKLNEIIAGVEQVEVLKDPLGQTTMARELDQGLELTRITCPIGVVTVIFESRPDALPQIASLCFKSGNAVILKGGKEASKTNNAVFAAIQRGVVRAGLPQDCMFLLESRESVDLLLRAEKYVDLVIPRGSNQLVRHIQNNTKIPVLGHADGLCHIFVDESADTASAAQIIVDAKTQYPSACNSVETLLIHKSKATELLTILIPQLLGKTVEIRGDAETIQSTPLAMRQSIKAASDDDWSTEYCELIIAIKIVGSIDEAIAHINEFGSHHTEAILTENKASFEKFFHQVNSAGVFLNASTRFADGFRYGFGAEVGISTGKLHPRGPVGLEGLITYKYKMIGAGHLVSDYVGNNAKKFSHRDILQA